MTVKRVVTPERFIHLSTDTKPTDGATSVRPGATACDDNGAWYITYDGTNWVPLIHPPTTKPKTVSVTKALAAASAYHAEDVLSESASNGVGTSWLFAAIARTDGGSGYITKVQAISETTNVTPRLVVFFFTATPTCELDDHAANTALLHADLANYIGRVELPAMSDVGTGDSETIATPSTYGNLPLSFTCATAADDLIAVVVTKDAFTQTATDDLVIRVTVEQY